MNHHLPELGRVMRTDFVVVRQGERPDGRGDERRVRFVRAGTDYYHVPEGGDETAVLPAGAKVPVVPHDAPLADAARSLSRSQLLLVAKDGEPIGYAAAADMLRAAIDSYRLLRAYFDTTLRAAEGALTLIDEEGRVAEWTDEAERLFAIAKDDIVGKPAAAFFREDALQSLRTLRTGESVRRKRHRPRPDLFSLINADPVRLDGRIVGAVAVESDITTQVRMQQELQHMTSKVHHLRREVARLDPSVDPFLPIRGTSRAILDCIETVRKIAATKATALITGESGTGKELFAKAIHDLREGRDAPFIAINCGAIPHALFESELFGYEKGAFSGADPKGKKGKIELAEGGTLFLDEIGEMPLDLQVKLLRVLQEKTYFPVGGSRLLRADCRIVAATNRDLKAMIADGKFREDLYYRLNVVTLDIPPLRGRKEDIAHLAQSFLHEFSLQYDRPVEVFPDDVVRELIAYDWPGNVRELRNAIERLVVFSSGGELSRDHLPAAVLGRAAVFPAADRPLPPPDRDGSYQDKLDAYEKRLLADALEREGGNKLALAKRLGISRATLYNKLKRLGL
ncbi:sigma-54 interaction domain-containing protein [Paenibacillus sp. GYB003]|uniref:sigma-54 interaction domain-containing protein n=1 Tax=Paenibacillus sp. GYB003 TaxID=2994392 RepID=UPI002F96BB94